MSVNSIMSVGVQGMQTSIGRANQAAGQIARVAANPDSGDLAAPLVDLKTSELLVKASASVVKSGDEMLGTLIDLKA